MNQARSGPYYAEDFEAKRPIPWMALLAVFVIAAVLVGAAAFYGDRKGFERGYAAGKAMPRPATPAPAAALTQWSCSAQERREYLGVCAARARQELKR